MKAKFCNLNSVTFTFLIELCVKGYVVENY